LCAAARALSRGPSVASVLLALAASLHAAQDTAARSGSFDHEHTEWTKVLAKHVAGDRLDYRALSADRATFDGYLAQLRAVSAADFASFGKEQQMAFWINAYNAHAVALVLTKYPVESIRDLGGVFSSVWKKKFIDLTALHPSGKPERLSLDDIEHAILRPKFKDARLHAALNCASESCPRLRGEAFVARRLDAQLDEQCRLWLADTARNRFDPARKRAEVSAIFDWFEQDFARDAGSVRGWITKYAPPEHTAWLQAPTGSELRFLDYSWKLNDVKR
jgi:hypothetical protein